MLSGKQKGYIKSSSTKYTMDSKLKQYLKEHKIKYKMHEHEAVFTVEQASKVKNLPDVFHTKNLFLKDENKKLFLVCMDAYKKLDLKSLKEDLEAKKKLSFCSPELLKNKLNLTPGSVSIFGLINAKPGEITLVLDEDLWSARKSGFHPNINTATLELSHEDLERFVNSLKIKHKILKLNSKE
jgi:Ala-tRNA(Pro) deacylase